MEDKKVEKQPKKMTLAASLTGFIVPIGLMIVLIFSGINLALAMLSAVVVLTIFGLIMGFSWKTIDGAMAEGIKSIASAGVIMILVGALVGTFMASGTIPAMLYYGFKIIKPAIFLPISFLLTLLVALCTGTSWGAVGTIGVVLIGMSSGLNIPLWYTAGAVISGAQMGDKMSPLSDSTLLAAASAETTVFENIVSMFYTTVPAAVICVVLYGILGMNNSGSLQQSELQILSDGLASGFRINVLMLIPMVIVLVLSVKQAPAFIAFTSGIFCAGVFAVLFQGVSVAQVFDYAMNGFVCKTGVESLDGLLSRGGISSMLEMVCVVLMAGMLSGLLDQMKVMDPMVEVLTSKVHSASGIVLATLVTTGVIAIPGAQYPALTIPAFAFRSTYDKMDIHRAVLSRSMEDFGVVLCAILPYGIATAYYSGTLGVSPLQYIPFTFLPIFSMVIAVINACLGIGVFHKKDPVKYRPLWRRVKNSRAGE